ADGHRLGFWVFVQRRQEDSISTDRKARLDVLGFVWDPRTERWQEGFEDLQAFMKEHGHCRVPLQHVTTDGHRLGKWVSFLRQREQLVSAERKALLDAVGFIWDVPTDQWEEGFKHLEAFAKDHGHCSVPRKHVTANGYRLGVWVIEQRPNQDRMPA